MKFLLSTFIFLFLLVPSVYSNGKEDSVTYGFLTEFDILTNFKDARESLKNWMENVGKAQKKELNILFYSDINEMYEDYKKQKLDMFVVSVDYFFKYRKEIEKISKSYWSISFSEDETISYYLISQKDEKIKNLSDFKNKTLSIKTRERQAYHWIDNLALKDTNKNIDNLFNKIIYNDKESTSLLNLYFKKSDFCVVSKKTWDTMLELNPSIAKKLKIIRKSESIFFPFIGIFSKNVNQINHDLFYSYLEELKKPNNINNNLVFDLLKFKQVFRLNNEQISILSNFYLEYNKNHE